MCISPHPDDEILGCGGSLLKAKEEKYDIYLCYLSYGEGSSPKLTQNKLKKIRKAESLEVCKELGLKDNSVFYLEIGDNKIDHNNFNNFKKLMSIIRNVRPDIVFIPDEKDSYNDHQEAALLAKRCLDMAGSNNFLKKNEQPWWVGNILVYEVSTPLSDYQYAVDISSFIDKKISLLSIYKSQTKNEGNVSDLIGDKAKYLSGYRAAFSVGEYREVFRVLRVNNII